MRVTTGNLWDIQAQVKVIPTNGVFKMDGEKAPTAIMGAGVAAQAAQRYVLLPWWLGDRLEKYGNRLYIFNVPGIHRDNLNGVGCTQLVTCPTKDDWRNPSTLGRLTLSLRQLAAAQKMHDWPAVYLPELGTGLGGLGWDVVEPVMREYLSDSFIVVRLEK